MNTKQLLNGVLAGFAGGVVFGVMMGMMGMLPMIGKMVGQPSAIVGFFVHMVISGVIGATFAIVLGHKVTGTNSGLGFGMAYGVIWWILGPLTLMPLMMGMGFGVNWNLTAVSAMLPSLMGHALYGLILGFVFAFCTKRSQVTTNA